MYHLATKHSDSLKTDRHHIKTSDFSLLTTAIPDNCLQLYRTSYAVRSAITATAELLVYIYPVKKWG